MACRNFTDLVIHPAQDVTVIFGESREFFVLFFQLIWKDI